MSKHYWGSKVLNNLTSHLVTWPIVVECFRMFWVLRYTSWTGLKPAIQGFCAIFLSTPKYSVSFLPFLAHPHFWNGKQSGCGCVWMCPLCGPPPEVRATDPGMQNLHVENDIQMRLGLLEEADSALALKKVCCSSQEHGDPLLSVRIYRS